MSITVNASELYLDYFIYIKDSSNVESVYISDGPFIIISKNANVTSPTSSDYLALVTLPSTEVYKLVYSNALNSWIYESYFATATENANTYRLASDVKIGNGVKRYFIYKRGYLPSSINVITNSNWNQYEIDYVNSYSDNLDLIPHGLTADSVKEIINESLNTKTESGNQAEIIQQSVTNTYIQYVNQEITLQELQTNINNFTIQLQEISETEGNTLADQIAINNALTQTQIVQDAANKDAIIQEMEDDLTVSSSTSSTIIGKINEANTAFNNYSQGNTTQTEAVTQINQYITQLTQLITPQTPTADINAINAAINTINGIKDSVTTHSDLDNSVSKSAQNSDKEEIEYLENIEAETTENIDSLKTKVDDSISESQANQVKNNVIAPILQNTLIVKVLPIAALFMVLAVTLGFKYRL